MQAYRMCGAATVRLCRPLLGAYNGGSGVTSRLLHTVRQGVGHKMGRNGRTKATMFVSRLFHSSRSLRLPVESTLALTCLAYLWKRQLRLYFANRPDIMKPYFRITHRLFLVLFACVAAHFLYYHEKIPVINEWRYINPWFEVPSYEHRSLFIVMKLRKVPNRRPASVYVNHHFKQLLKANIDIPWIQKNVDVNSLYLVNTKKDMMFSNVHNEILMTTYHLSQFKDDNEVALAMAHELAHLVLRHNDWLSSVHMLQYGLYYLCSAAVWLCIAHERTTLILFTLLYIVNRISIQNVLRVFKTELEADIHGMRLAAKACYNPSGLKEGLMRFRSDQVSSSSKSSWLACLTNSTHPPLFERFLVIDKHLDEALAVRQECNCPPLPDIKRQFTVKPQGTASFHDDEKDKIEKEKLLHA